jgi:integrase
MKELKYRLTDDLIRAAMGGPKPTKLADSGGLFLRIAANPGASKTPTKTWAFAYVSPLTLRAAECGFGQYGSGSDQVSITTARFMHEQARKALAEGRCPASEKRDQKRAEALAKKEQRGKAVLTFKAYSDRWLAAGRKHWTAPYAEKNRQTMEHVCKEIGSMPLDQVQHRHVLAIIRGKTDEGHAHAANRIRQLINDIYRNAMLEERCKHNPAADVRKAIKLPATTHHRHLKTMKEIGDFWNAIDALAATTQESVLNCLRTVALTACRKNEIMKAQWDWLQYDGKKVTLVIPEGMMKMKKEHVVPLSTQVIKIIERQRELREEGSEYIFTTLGKKVPLNRSTLNEAILRMSLPGARNFSPHGLRSTFASAARSVGWDADLVELTLAHGKRGIQRSYIHHDRIPDRALLLQFYSDLIEKQARGEPYKIVHTSRFPSLAPIEVEVEEVEFA